MVTWVQMYLARFSPFVRRPVGMSELHRAFSRAAVAASGSSPHTTTTASPSSAPSFEGRVRQRRPSRP